MSGSLLLVLTLALSLAACERPASPATDRATPPSSVEDVDGEASLVVAELFTSEGCSSCPPADRLLARLAARDSLDGVPLLALSYHVDYWDRLGWADPFGSPVFTARQRAYAATLDGRVYTPQLVVGGDRGFVGSNERAARAAVAEAGREAPRASVSLAADAADGEVLVRYTVDAELPAEARLHLLLVQRAGRSDVARGENRGRRLDHAHIVRAVDTRELGAGTARLVLPDGVAADDVFVAALVQPGRVGRILGAARADVGRRP